MSDVVEKLWSYCHVLRHDGVDYSDYIEQISYLIFLKMAAEREVELPPQANWRDLLDAPPTQILYVYSDALREMEKYPGPLGDIFRGAENRINTPTSLSKLAKMIDETEWSHLNVDVQASIFEGLLERAAAEGKKGAGQYFTPRPLIEAIVNCVRPDISSSSGFTVIDPACGTGGFLAAAHEWFLKNSDSRLSRQTIARLANASYYGVDLVARPRRLALMNMYLRGVTAHIEVADSIYQRPPPRRFNLVLTNPPFGSQGVLGVPDRPDFQIRTSNKQLNFIQHAMALLKHGGTAAIVVPDNVLFSSQGTDVIRMLAEQYDVHTVLRCPNGTFTPYTQGTKTNVIFISTDKPTEITWIYDGRTNVANISRRNPLTRDHFAEFEGCYNPAAGDRERSVAHSPQGRWRRFPIDALRARDFRIDSLRWIQSGEDKVTGNSEPLMMIDDAIKRLAQASQKLESLHSTLRERL